MRHTLPNGNARGHRSWVKATTMTKLLFPAILGFLFFMAACNDPGGESASGNGGQAQEAQASASPNAAGDALNQIRAAQQEAQKSSRLRSQGENSRFRREEQADPPGESPAPGNSRTAPEKSPSVPR